MNSLIELRQYPMLPARLADFHSLMGETVPGLFARHGFRPALDFWESHAGRFTPALIYALTWPSLAAREAAWAAFYSDPDWIEALAQNFAGAPRVDHAYVSLHLPAARTVISAGLADPGSDAISDLVFATAGTGLAATESVIAAEVLPAIAAAGGQLRHQWHSLWGRPRDELALLIDWPDEAAALAVRWPCNLQISRQIMKRLSYPKPPHIPSGKEPGHG